MARVVPAAILGGVLATFLVTAAPASPQTETPEAPPTTVPGPPVAIGGAFLPDPSLQPGVALVRVRGAAYERAVETYDQTLAQRFTTASLLDQARIALTIASSDRVVAQQAVDAGRAARTTQITALVGVERTVRQLALAAYVSAGTGQDPAYYVLEGGLPGPELQRQLSEESTEYQFDEQERLHGELAATDAQLAADMDVLADRAHRLVEATAEVEQLTIHLYQLDQSLVTQATAVVDARRRASVAGVDMSLVALDAYVAAENSLAASDPSCGLGWWMLAGVARIESRHGTFGGRSVRPDGRVTPSIIGIPLDGTNNTRLIADSDGGRLDGDAVYDRAVGPMQFIPTTWATWRADGNGDGREDPHNIYDAALAAGTYLCAEGGSLSGGGLATAYFAYNNSDVYVSDVTRHARRYQAAVSIVVPPPTPPPSAPSATPDTVAPA